jgi:hypothetical protein
LGDERRISLAAFDVAILAPWPRGKPVAAVSLGIGFRCFFPGASTAPPLRFCLSGAYNVAPLVSDACSFVATLPLFDGLAGAAIAARAPARLFCAADFRRPDFAAPPVFPALRPAAFFTPRFAMVSPIW